MTPARQAEADRVELVYYWALNRLGNSLAIDSKELWERSVSASGELADQKEFVRRSKQLIAAFRAEAHELAVGYYRLVRALRTGTTVAVDGEDDGDTVSLEELRQDFEGIADDIHDQTESDPIFDNGANEARFDEPMPEYQPGDDVDEIEVENIADIQQLIDDANKEAESQADSVLQNLGIKNLEKKIKAIEKAKPKKGKKDDKGKKRSEARRDAGNRQAAAAMRIMLNAARGLTYDLSETDQRLIGWARYSRTGTPCGFCAMLLSREAMYRTRATAQAKRRADGTRSKDVYLKDVDKFHDNCRCVAIPIFSVDQYEKSSLYEQNRFYRKLWDDNIKGEYGGNDALNAWRTLLRKRQIESPKPKQTQAAA